MRQKAELRVQREPRSEQDPTPVVTQYPGQAHDGRRPDGTNEGLHALPANDEQDARRVLASSLISSIESRQVVPGLFIVLKPLFEDLICRCKMESRVLL